MAATITILRQGNIAIVDEKYMVTQDGEVYRICKHGFHRQKLRKHTHGYLRCTISGGDFYVHRLVALCFIENQRNYPEINHKDGDKTNNHVENPEWCSRSHNNRHAFQTGLRSYAELSEIAKKPRLSTRKFTYSDLQLIRKMISDGKSDGQIAHVVKGTRGAIFQIRTGKTYKEA